MTSRGERLLGVAHAFASQPDERLEGGRGVASSRVIEAEPGKGRCPILQHPGEASRFDIGEDILHLAGEGSLKAWVEAYEHGRVRVSGDAAVTKLLGAVIQRQLARA